MIRSLGKPTEKSSRNMDADFREAYRVYVEQRPLPDNLEERIIESAEAHGKRDEAHRFPHEHRSHSSSSRRMRRLGFASACAMGALFLSISLPVFLESLADSHEGSNQIAGSSNEREEGPHGSDASIGLFPLFAYADDGRLSSYSDDGSLLLPGDGNLISFDVHGSDGTNTYWYEEGDNRMNAEFLPNTFTVKGSDISKVQAHISNGELYRMETELIDLRKDEGFKWVGEEGLDPADRGTRKHYEDCDALGALYIDGDSGTGAFNAQLALRYKRIGDTLDIDKASEATLGSEDLKFGLLHLSEESLESDRAYSCEDRINGDGSSLKWLTYPELENAVLTITVTYADGSTCTQAIELHEGLLGVQEQEDGTQELVQPIRFYDPSLGDVTGEACLYGIVLETNEAPFPYSGEKANEYLHDVMAAVTISEE